VVRVACLVIFPVTNLVNLLGFEKCYHLARPCDGVCGVGISNQVTSASKNSVDNKSRNGCHREVDDVTMVYTLITGRGNTSVGGCKSAYDVAVRGECGSKRTVCRDRSGGVDSVGERSAVSAPRHSINCIAPNRVGG